MEMFDPLNSVGPEISLSPASSTFGPTPTAITRVPLALTRLAEAMPPAMSSLLVVPPEPESSAWTVGWPSVSTTTRSGLGAATTGGVRTDRIPSSQLVVKEVTIGMLLTVAFRLVTLAGPLAPSSWLIWCQG